MHSINTNNQVMILEAVDLYVHKDRQKAFEADFVEASEFISSISGYLGHSLNKCLEVENKYILLVSWGQLEDHTVSFRESTEYQQWKNLLHHYYDPFPEVEHYKPVFNNLIQF